MADAEHPLHAGFHSAQHRPASSSKLRGEALARVLFNQYVRQLTTGCGGVTACTSLLCASNPFFIRLSPEQAARKAIGVIQQDRHNRLCPRLTISSSSFISYADGGDGTVTCEFRVVDQLRHLRCSDHSITPHLTAAINELLQHDTKQSELGKITPRQLDTLLMSLAVHHFFNQRPHAPIAVVSLIVPQIERLLRLMHRHHHLIANPRPGYQAGHSLDLVDWRLASASWAADGDVTARRLQAIAVVTKDKLRTYFEHGYIAPSTATVPLAAAVLLFAILLDGWATREACRQDVRVVLGDSLADDITAVISSVTPLTFPKLGAWELPAETPSTPRQLIACVEDEVKEKVQQVKKAYDEHTCDQVVEWVGHVDFTGKEEFLRGQIVSLIHGGFAECWMGFQLHAPLAWSARARWAQQEPHTGETEHDPFAGKLAVAGLRMCIAATPPLDLSEFRTQVEKIVKWATAGSDDSNWYWGHSRDQRQRALFVRSKDPALQRLYPSYTLQRSLGQLVLADELLRFVEEHKETEAICSPLLCKLFPSVFRDLRETVQQQKVIAQRGHEWQAADKWIPPHEPFTWYRTSITHDIDIYLVLCKIITQHIPSSDRASLGEQLLQTLDDYVCVLESFSMRQQQDSKYQQAQAQLALRMDLTIRQLVGVVWLGTTRADILCDRVLSLLEQSRNRSQQPDFLHRNGFTEIKVQLDSQCASELFVAIRNGELAATLVGMCPSRADYDRLQGRIPTSKAMRNSVIPVDPLQPIAVTSAEKVAMTYSWFVEFWNVNLRRLFGRWVGGQPEFFVDRQMLHRELSSHIQETSHLKTAQDWLTAALVFADHDDQDWATALHIMLPAVEWILQVMVQSRRLRVRNSRCRSIGMNLDILSRNNPDPFEKFFFDVHLRLLFTNRYACNFRNTPAHGLLSSVGIVSIDSDRLSFFAVLHCFLVCSVLYSNRKLSSPSQRSKAMQSALAHAERVFASMESAGL